MQCRSQLRRSDSLGRPVGREGLAAGSVMRSVTEESCIAWLESVADISGRSGLALTKSAPSKHKIEPYCLATAAVLSSSGSESPDSDSRLKANRNLRTTLGPG